MKKQLLKSLLMAVVGVGLMAGSALALSIHVETNTSASVVDVSDTDGKVDWGGLLGKYKIDITGISEPTYFNGPLALTMLNYDISGDTTTDTDWLTLSVTDSYTGTYKGFLTSINAAQNTFTDTDFVVTISDGTHTYTGTLSDLIGTYDETLTVSTPELLNAWTLTMTATLTGKGISDFDATTSPVPEPATMLLFGTGIVGLAGIVRRKKAN